MCQERGEHLGPARIEVDEVAEQDRPGTEDARPRRELRGGEAGREAIERRAGVGGQARGRAVTIQLPLVGHRFRASTWLPPRRIDRVGRCAAQRGRRPGAEDRLDRQDPHAAIVRWPRQLEHASLAGARPQRVPERPVQIQAPRRHPAHDVTTDVLERLPLLGRQPRDGGRVPPQLAEVEGAGVEEGGELGRLDLGVQGSITGESQRKRSWCSVLVDHARDGRTLAGRAAPDATNDPLGVLATHARTYAELAEFRVMKTAYRPQQIRNGSASARR